VTVWGVQGENCARFLSKGRPVAIDGRLEWREWSTDDGTKRQAVEIVADSMQFLGAPDDTPAIEPDPRARPGRRRRRGHSLLRGHRSQGVQTRRPASTPRLYSELYRAVYWVWVVTVRPRSSPTRQQWKNLPRSTQESSTIKLTPPTLSETRSLSQFLGIPSAEGWPCTLTA
jgi:single-stranded DNA-binding protein